jgi:ERCC4-type nuclease
MLLVDYRRGSEHLAAPLEAAGFPVYRKPDGELPTLGFADVAFTGRGPGGKPIEIGIELKRLSDLVSSLRTGRLSGHQLPGLVGENAAYDRVWLIIEGQWTTNRDGLVCVQRYNRRKRRMEWRPIEGNMFASEMQKRVLTFELCGGVHVHWSNEPEDTLHFIQNLYRWWSDKDSDKHASHLAVHDQASFLDIGKVREALMKYPHIGRKASKAVIDHFGTIRRAGNASVAEWADIEVMTDKGKKRRIGTNFATEIVDFVNGRNQ